MSGLQNCQAGGIYSCAIQQHVTFYANYGNSAKINSSFSYTHNHVNAYKDIYEQYVDQASFLWILRSIAVAQPHYSREDIYELEQRIDAQLDGLMTAVEDAWEICLQALELEEPGEVFTAAVIAFRSQDIAKIQTAIEVGLSNSEAAKGLISAMGWLPGKLVHPWIEKFLTSKDLNHKYLALAACSVRRENPGEYLTKILEREDCKQHVKLYARAIRLIGEICRQDLIPYLNEAINAKQDDIRFWSNWSAILLGNRAAVENLEPYVFDTGFYQRDAINIAFRVLPVEQARNWISKLAAEQGQERTVIKATGILGDPHAVNWLITKMREPANARLAAEAFTLITGIDMEKYQLVAEIPLASAAQPNNDTEDEDVSLDEDENLLWPNPEKVSSLWMNQGQSFIVGQRCFMGQRISAEVSGDNLANINQRQRHALAMELALIDSSVPLQNTKARIQG